MKKIIIRSKRKPRKNRKNKNPYAICTWSIGRNEGTQERSKWDKDAKDKYDRCVKDIKENK